MGRPTHARSGRLSGQYSPSPVLDVGRECSRHRAQVLQQIVSARTAVSRRMHYPVTARSMSVQADLRFAISVLRTF